MSEDSKEKKEKKKSKKGDSPRSKKSKVKKKSTDAEPLNPALKEPDAMAIVQKDEATGPTVSYGRKKDLLVQARADRRKWVQKIPLPYSKPRDPNNIWSLEDRLNHVQSSSACKRLPIATKVLSELYGLESNIRTSEEVAQRVDALVSHWVSGDNALEDIHRFHRGLTLLSYIMQVRPFLSDDKLLEENDELLAEAISKDDSEVVRAYHHFWSTLLKPECALLVQGMRNFLGNLEGTNMEMMATSLKSYLDSTYESMKSHIAWKDNTDHTNIRRSLESFVYGHSQTILGQLEWGGLFSMSEEQWEERLAKLQFVQPSHLEIECLNHDGLNVDELLQRPIEALLSMDQFYSPYEKLQRILVVFQGVNAALSTALSLNKSTERKLPSADDVLPTIILTVLQAKPKHMFRNLQLVEVFAPQEYLRGEAGYAFTNLYGAVQFLQDLDMEKPDSLSISPEDFRKGLEESARSTQKRLNVIKRDKQEQEGETKKLSINVRNVREARLRGEDVNLEWAMKWAREHPEEERKDANIDLNNTLPDGFSRAYSFMSTRPEDVRISDLSKLLSEYRMLVHVTEELLGERSARLASEKRKKESQRNQNLDESFFAIDESTK